jgi:hypothetical protein
LIGAKVIEAGEIICAKFGMELIKRKVQMEADVEQVKLTFVANTFHCQCLNSKAYMSFIRKEAIN